MRAGQAGPALGWAGLVAPVTVRVHFQPRAKRGSNYRPLLAQNHKPPLRGSRTSTFLNEQDHNSKIQVASLPATPKAKRRRVRSAWRRPALRPFRTRREMRPFSGTWACRLQMPAGRLLQKNSPHFETDTPALPLYKGSAFSGAINLKSESLCLLFSNALSRTASPRSRT
jgi:hypothetical protein